MRIERTNPIKALRDFGNVKKGDLGGFIESKNNLSQEGNAWAYDNACIYENATLNDNATAHDNVTMHGNAKAYDNIQLYDNTDVSEDAIIVENARLYDNTQVYGCAHIGGNAVLLDNVHVYGNVSVSGLCEIADDAELYGTTCIMTDGVYIGADALLYKDTDYMFIMGLTDIDMLTCFFCDDNTVKLRYNNAFYTTKQFSNMLNDKHNDIPCKDEYLAMLDMIEKHFANKL